MLQEDLRTALQLHDKEIEILKAICNITLDSSLYETKAFIAHIN